MSQQKIVIGLCGKMVAGKGTIANYLKENYNASLYGFSGPLRDVLKRLHLETSRGNLSRLSEILRDSFGQDLISATIVKDINEDESHLIVLDGIRRPSDLEKAAQLTNFILVSVDTEQERRHQRLLKRSQNSDDQSKTFADFQSDEQAEAESLIPEVMAQASHHIDNNGDFEALYAQVDELMKTLLKHQ